MNDNITEVMRITREGVWVNPDMAIDETAKAVLDALSSQVQVLVQRAVEDEREACAKLCEKERNDLLWREGQTLPQGEPRLIHMASTAGYCAQTIRARGEK